jgi:DNA-binding transcriptional LysR family regulator
MRLLVSRHLENFLALCETRNMRVAAERKGITQPALTKSLKILEDEVGTQLFLRTAKGMEPTPAGELFYRHVRSIDQAARFAELDIRQSIDRTEGRLRIGVGPGLAVSSFPKVLVKFQKDFPEVQVAVEVHLTDHLVDQLVRDNLDVVASALPVHDLPPHFVSLRLTSIEMALICRPGHPLTRERLVTAEMLGRYGCVTFMDDRSTTRFRESLGQGEGMTRPMTQTNSVGLMLALLSITDHYSVVGSNIVERARQLGLVTLPAQVSLPRREVDLMCKRTLLHSRPVQALLGGWRDILSAETVGRGAG